jgi:hypothetical protein
MMMVITAVQFDRAKERLHTEGTAPIALLHRTRRLLVWKKLRIAEELLEQSASIPVQGGSQFLFQPLRVTAKTLLATQPLAR